MRWVFPQAQFWVLSLSLLLFRTIRLRSRLTLFLYTFLWNLRHTYSHTLNKCIIHSFFSIAIYTIEVLLVFNLLPLFLQPEWDSKRENGPRGMYDALYRTISPKRPRKIVYNCLSLIHSVCVLYFLARNRSTKNLSYPKITKPKSLGLMSCGAIQHWDHCVQSIGSTNSWFYFKTQRVVSL